MDIGTLLLYIVVGVGIIDAVLLLIGPRLRGYETGSFAMAFMGFFSSVGALVWMGFNIFTNNFVYEYIWQTSSVSSDWTLKLSALWAGQSGSLVFWTALSFILYFGFRIATRGYEDDVIIYRSYIIMALSTVLIAVNAITADPFKLIEGTAPLDGLGLNPLLRTIWNVIHPPLVFIAYALILVPFAVKLAGFTVRTEERNQDKIPLVESIVKLTTATSWLMLSVGITLGGYWAYIVLGWGGYWAWDPVETSSLIPWLLLTGYYHASAIWRKNDVLRDAFLVFAYVTVVFATWTTRSGILTSVHGFELSLVSWTMLGTLLGTFVIATLITLVSGFRDMEDEDDFSQESESSFSMRGLKQLIIPTFLTIIAIVGLYSLRFIPGFVLATLDSLVIFTFMLYLLVVSLYLSWSDIREDPIRIGLIGILIITAVSAAGIVIPAATNLFLTLTVPGAELIAIDILWFRLGFYLGSILLIISGFFCMKNSMFHEKRKIQFIVILILLGAVIGLGSLLTGVALPTSFWPANLLVPVGAGALIYMLTSFIRYLAGKEPGAFTMKRMGRHMLHFGMIVLLLGVFMSENVVHESIAEYREDEFRNIGSVSIRVTDIDLVYWEHEYDFLMVVTLQVIEGEMLVGTGFVTIKADPDWGMVSHQVYVHSNAFRDVFVALTAFATIGNDAQGPVFSVRLIAKILPFISFVWLGAFLMVSSIIPMAFQEASRLVTRIREKGLDLYGEEDTEEPLPEVISDHIE